MKHKDILDTKSWNRTIKALSILGGNARPTPPSIINRILDGGNIDWADPNKKYLDPTCGVGTFSRECYIRLIKHHSPEHINNNMLYMIDNSSIKIKALRKVGFKNIIHGDFLSENIAQEWNTMNFDVIAFNPPYQRINDKGNKDTTYYVQFQKKAIQWLKTGGYLGLVMPNAFISPYTKAGKALEGIKPSLVIPRANRYFDDNGNGVWTEIGVIMGTKVSQPLAQMPDCPYDFDGNIVVGNLGRLETTIREASKTGHIGMSISRKVFTLSENKVAPVNKKDDLTTENFVSFSLVYGRYTPNKPKGGNFTLSTYANSEDEHDSKFYFSLDVDTPERAEYLAWFYKKSLLMRFINHYHSFSPFVGGCPVIRGIVSYPPADLMEQDDDKVFEAFGISEEEADKIKEWLV
jgi:16S rRNA G966 N2-methylase RsmD